VLACAGGLAGLVAAYALHGVLVRLITQIAPQFAIDFALDGRVLAFSIGATGLAAFLFGMLPAWLATGVDTGAALNAEGRTTTGSAGRLRWGKLLVIAQLALSLPLLAGAGLLARTLYNLQNADLGFPREHVLLARVDAESGGYELNRRGPLLRDLLEDIRHVPGVQGATFSENGVLSGHDSADLIQVEGYTSKGRNDRGSRWDQVGPQYFSTLGIPIIMGREITEADRAASTKVCVINEAFRNLFFANRNPVGMHITNVYGDKRTTCEIVGVAKNAHTDAIRPPQVRPRYYVPTTQPLAEFSGATFEVRVSHDMNGVAEGLRRAIHRVDPTLPIVSLDTLDERVAAQIALERVMAGLAAAFAVSAVGLAAIGLYGVLAYGTTRRRTEIGIRIALGAQPTRVIAMILRETSHVLIAGLILGGVLAYVASRWISSQLYGLAPHDPLTLTAATAVLVIIALAAAYLPARRVSRLDPVSALRQ
jgi:predicted permease